MLTPKERLKTVLSGKKADRTPCICPGGMMNMITEELMKTVQLSAAGAYRCQDDGGSCKGGLRTGML